MADRTNHCANCVALDEKLAATRELLSSALGNGDAFHDQAVDRLLTLKELKAKLADIAAEASVAADVGTCERVRQAICEDIERLAANAEPCAECFDLQYNCRLLPDGTWTEEGLCLKHRAEPCGTCEGTRRIASLCDKYIEACPDCGCKSCDLGTIYGDDGSAKPCPDCAEGEA